MSRKPNDPKQIWLLSASDVDRFWLKVNRGATGDCWNWMGRSSVKGYGEFHLQRQKKQAHRVSWTLHYGIIPDDLFVLHRCDSPSCVNPRHLFLGTGTDNMHDMMTKGRARPPRGEINGRSKLSQCKAREIRHRFKSAPCKLQVLADAFGVSKSQISRILRNERWLEQ